jgi:hypothetical protein
MSVLYKSVFALSPLFFSTLRSTLRMFTERSLNVHWIFTECSLNVHCFFIECSLNVHCFFTNFTLYTYWTYECLQYLMSVLYKAAFALSPLFFISSYALITNSVCRPFSQALQTSDCKINQRIDVSAYFGPGGVLQFEVIVTKHLACLIIQPKPWLLNEDSLDEVDVLRLRVFCLIYMCLVYNVGSVVSVSLMVISNRVFADRRINQDKLYRDRLQIWLWKLKSH